MSHPISRALAVLALVLGMAVTGTPARAANPLVISGHVRDSVTDAPLQNVCITLGPPIRCWGAFGTNPGLHTDVNGYFMIDLDAISASPGGTWDIYAVCDALCVTSYPSGYETSYSGKFVVSGPYTVEMKMLKGTAPPPPGSCAVARTDLPTQTLYLPNITRTFGGPTGWYTPFIVQNTGTVNTDLEVSFYKFSDGTCVSRINVAALKPGTSYDNNPNDNGKNPTLPDSTQFSVVVRSFGATVVGVVNEVQGSGERSEAMAYDGFTAGATTVSLPNITRRFGGVYVTPFIIQNLGTTATTAVATFRPFDGVGGPVTVTRTINPGAAKDVDPNSDRTDVGAPGLIDGKQYAVTITSQQPVVAVVNTVADAPSVANPLAFATDGVMAGGATIYGAYAAKNAQGIGRYSPIIVQNLGTAAVAPVLTLTPLAGSPGTANTYTFPSIAANSSKAFDPRFSFTDQTTPCTGHGSTCLADGEYAFKITGGTGASLAAQVNVVSTATAMGYAATATPAAKFFLPNITKSLCFCGAGAVNGVGWTTPIILQSVTATSVTLTWYRFSDGQLVATQTVALTPGSGARIDPWTVPALAADAQYSVVADAGTTGTITAIVTELAPGGDNVMIYEGFPAP